MVKTLKNFVNYFKTLYLRYLLVTELYMVEEWEKIVIHLVMLMLFLAVWYFNMKIVVHFISQFRGLHTNYCAFLAK